MSMPGVAMVVRMAGVAVTVVVAMVVRMPGHAPILPASKLARTCSALIRYFDNAPAGMD
jgi:hypothetical protein